MKKILFALVAAVALAGSAYSQQLKVATGSPKGTYAAVFKELSNFCGTELTMVETPTSGAVENTDLLLGNQVNAIFTQTDILFMRARTEDLGNVKTLIALYPEQLHFVARSGVRKEGGTLGFGAKEVQLVDIAQLAGRTLGAAGGSAETAKLVRLQTEIPFQLVTTFKSNDEVSKALAAGQIDAALFVGGQPLGAVKDLGPEFTLLRVNDATAERLKGVYQTHAKGGRRVTLNYSKMGAAGVPTVSTDSLLVTREYRSANMLASLSKFRNCVLTRLDDIKDATGTHPAWQNVDGANRGKWAYYELPAAAVAKK